jgi:hypothetical protein
VAQLHGILSRIHGALRLHGVSMPERAAALNAWCYEREKQIDAEKDG